MLSVVDIEKAYGGRTLFRNVSLQVNPGDRIGLVGTNGSGKSTLFSLILGHETPDAGKVELLPYVKAGYLPQENIPVGDETVLELATAVTPELAGILRQLAVLDPAAHESAAEFYHLQSRFEDLGGPQIRARASKILLGLSFRESDFDRPVRQMSGGWVMRAHLARLLVEQPDLLLLDEPTNHLDLETLLWFQGWLKAYPGAIVVISHDRDFLNELVTVIVEIRQARLWRYRGNYDQYLEQRQVNEDNLLAAYKNQQREIARLQRFVDRFRAKNTKASQAQSKLKQIERMVPIEAPSGPEAVVDFQFPQPERSGLKVVCLQNVSCGYGERMVYRNLDLEIQRGQRVVLVGPNGAGKSTLLKTLAGVLAPTSGERLPGINVRAGYYSQYRLENLHATFTVLDEGFNTPQRLTETFVRTVLGSFLFRGDDVFKKVSVLSGGEKSRLALVRLLLDPPNLLLMDEPTTHLDLASVDALIEALRQFQGTLVFISHDVYFIRSLANHVIQVQDGRLTHYPGDYQYYLDKTAARAATTAAAAPPARAPAADSPEGTPAEKRRQEKRLAAEQRQARYRQCKAQENSVLALEQEIATLESRQAELTAELQNQLTYQQPGRPAEINIELTRVVQRLKELAPRWEAEATRLAEMQHDSTIQAE